MARRAAIAGLRLAQGKESSADIEFLVTYQHLKEFSSAAFPIFIFFATSNDIVGQESELAPLHLYTRLVSAQSLAVQNRLRFFRHHLLGLSGFATPSSLHLGAQSSKAKCGLQSDNSRSKTF